MKNKSNSDEPLKFIIYARKSSEGTEKQMASLPDQMEAAHNIVKNNGYKVVKIFQESASASKYNNRPKFNEMVKMIQSGKANAIICWQTNRLARNPLENGMVQHLLLNRQIQLIHTNDRVYRPGDSAIIFGVEASIATQTSIDIGRNASRGMHSKNKNGGCNGVAPQGYLNGRNEDNQPIVIRDEKRFPLIQKAFRLYLTGNYSVPELMQILNDDWHYITKKRKQSGGKPLSLAGLHEVLKNPFYMGKVRDFDDPNIFHQGAWEPMITEDEYWRVQRLKNRHTEKYNLPPKVSSTARRYELKGLMTCASCGCSIIGEPHRRPLANGNYSEHLYYRCTHKKATKTCELRGGVTEKDLFKQIDDLLDSYTIHPLLYDWGIEILKDLKNQEITERYDVAKMQHSTLKDIEKQLHELVDLRTKGFINDELFKVESEQYQSLIEDIKQSNQDIEERSKNWYEIIGKTLETLKDPKDKFSNADGTGEKRSILQAIGPKAILTERQLGVNEQSQKVLTAKIIEVEPYPWVEKLVKSAKKIEAKLDKVLTTPQQSKNDPKRSLYLPWLLGLDSNQ